MSKITVAEKEFEIGRISPAQIIAVTRLTTRIANILKGSDVSNDDTLGNVFYVVERLEEDDIISLAAALIGSSKEFAKENFDIGWFVEALAITVEETDLSGVIANFSRIVSRIAR